MEQKGSFGESFDEHNNHYSESKLQQWKRALTEIANLAGFHRIGCRSVCYPAVKFIHFYFYFL